MSDAKGKAKELAGKITSDRDTEREGAAEQGGGHTAGDRASEATQSAKESIDDAVSRDEDG